MDPSQIVEKVYDQIAEAYTSRYRNSPFLLENIEKFSSKLPLVGKVLDLGCGSGRASELFHQKGFEVTGIDFSDKMLGFARSKVSGVKFLKMDMRELKFPSESFDGIWSSFSLLHIPKKQMAGVLSECFRVLKKCGILFICVSLGKDTEELQDEWLKKGAKMFFYEMSKDSLVRHIKKAGFLLEEVQTKINHEENDYHPILYTYVRK
jgi:ubiquinone/menaquinone biosynthesis C-methylase UbiE